MKLMWHLLQHLLLGQRIISMFIPANSNELDHEKCGEMNNGPKAGERHSLEPIFTTGFLS